MDKVNSLQMYALINTSAASSEVVETVKKVVANYGRRIRNGFVLTPHGFDEIVFFEIRKKGGPIVEALTALVRMYPGLYPVYVVQENKDHLPKHAEGSSSQWWMVDEVKFQISNMNEEKTREFMKRYLDILKRIYRQDSVFIKSFIYLGKSGTVHVMSFNSERPIKFRGGMLGVPEWNEVMERIMTEVGAEEVQKMAVRYTNVDE